jgi:hypothetical protein
MDNNNIFLGEVTSVSHDEYDTTLTLTYADGKKVSVVAMVGCDDAWLTFVQTSGPIEKPRRAAKTPSPGPKKRRKS